MSAGGALWSRQRASAFTVYVRVIPLTRTALGELKSLPKAAGLCFQRARHPCHVCIAVVVGADAVPEVGVLGADALAGEWRVGRVLVTCVLP